MMRRRNAHGVMTRIAGDRQFNVIRLAIGIRVGDSGRVRIVLGILSQISMHLIHGLNGRGGFEGGAGCGSAPFARAVTHDGNGRVKAFQ